MCLKTSVTFVSFANLFLMALQAANTFELGKNAIVIGKPKTDITGHVFKTSHTKVARKWVFYGRSVKLGDFKVHLSELEEGTDGSHSRNLENVKDKGRKLVTKRADRLSINSALRALSLMLNSKDPERRTSRLPVVLIPAVPPERVLFRGISYGYMPFGRHSSRKMTPLHIRAMLLELGK